MGFAINTNIAAMNSYRNLSNTQNDLSQSLERLSSGLRINRAADDAAGLAISEGLRSQIGGLEVAARNAQDGISVIQTAEGALTEVHSILQRMRDLAVQAGNDSNSTEAREAIATEASALADELGRIGESTNFNGIQLLDGSAGELSFQIGADADASSQIKVDLSTSVSAIANTVATGTSGTSFDVLTPTDVTGTANFAIGDATSGTTVSVTLGAAGSYNTVQQVADALNEDANFSASLSATVNETNQLVVSSLSGEVVNGGNTPGTAGDAIALLMTDDVVGTPGGLDFSSASGAAAAITTIDSKITQISTARSELGASQNRLESAINTLNVSKENLSAAESRIRDTDMAAEMMNFTRAQILSQAGTAMLAQANMSNQGVLQLLG